MQLASKWRRGMRGFTLVELIISIGIMILMTGILLMNYPESAIRITLINSVHSVALLMREAQVRGSAIDSVNTSVGGYGVYANLSSPTSLTLFADSVTGLDGTTSTYGLPVGNGLYETTPVNELKSTLMLPNRYVIKKLCVGQSFPFTCNTSETPAITSLIVSFVRPNPQPHIYVNETKDTSYSAGCIEIWSPRGPASGHVRSIEVYNSGMIRTTIGGCDNN